MFARDRGGTAGSSVPYNETISQGRIREEDGPSHLTKPVFKEDPPRGGPVAKPAFDKDDKEGNIKRLKREEMDRFEQDLKEEREKYEKAKEEHQREVDF